MLYTFNCTVRACAAVLIVAQSDIKTIGVAGETVCGLTDRGRCIAIKSHSDYSSTAQQALSRVHNTPQETIPAIASLCQELHDRREVGLHGGSTRSP
jgi:hypothetical protein